MSLRDELEALRGGGEATVRFRELDRLARRTVLRLPRGGPEPEDLRQLLLTDLLARKPGRKPEKSAVDALLELDDQGLAGAVSNRLRQLGLEDMQDYNAHRALSQHVARALAEPDTSPAGPPGTLRGANRFSYEAIKQAVDWLQGEQAREQRSAGVRGEPKRLSAKEVLRLLRARYPLFDAQVGAPERRPRREGSESSRGAAAEGPAVRRSSARPSTYVRRKMDGEAILRRLEKRLPSKKFDAFRRRQRGDGFEQIAKAHDIGLATAHAWVVEAEQQFQVLVKDSQGAPRHSVGTVKHAIREAAKKKTRS